MAMTLPSLTPEALRTGIVEMCTIGTEMLRLTRDAFLQGSSVGLDKVAGLGRDLHAREKRLTDHTAMQIREHPWSLGLAEHLVFLPAALERIGDSVELLARCVNGMHKEGVPFSELAITEIVTLFNRGANLVDAIAGVIRAGDRTALAGVGEAGAAFRAFCDEAAARHHDRVLRGTCTPRASSMFLAMVDNFREIGRYVRRMSAEIEKTLPAS
jgi:Na+/phosphate symporter